jgi:membrane fusion protein (multidrug efflux system)
MQSTPARSRLPRVIALGIMAALGAGAYLARDHLPQNWIPGGLLPSSTAAPVPAAQAMPPVPVYVAKAQTETLIRRSRAIGTLTASDAVTISPEIAGRVVLISDKQGGQVQEGDLLAELDTAMYRAQIADATAKKVLWQANAERARSLMAKGAGTQKALDESVAELGIAEAALNLANATIAKTRITAPFSGELGLRQVSIGEYLTPGQAIFTLARIDRLNVDFTLPQTELAVVKPGTRVAVSTDAYPGEMFSGAVLAIDPNLDPAARAVSIRAEIENRDGRLKPGLFIEVDIEAGKIENAITLPEESLVARGDKVFVYELKDDKAELVPVVTGVRESGKVQIVSGIESGAIVVTDGQMKLRPGATAKIVDR